MEKAHFKIFALFDFLTAYQHHILAEKRSKEALRFDLETCWNGSSICQRTPSPTRQAPSLHSNLFSKKANAFKRSKSSLPMPLLAQEPSPSLHAQTPPNNQIPNPSPILPPLFTAPTIYLSPPLPYLFSTTFSPINLAVDSLTSAFLAFLAFLAAPSPSLFLKRKKNTHPIHPEPS
jgi:hypothetical protein